MPILEPSTQYFLVTSDTKHTNDTNGYSFFLKYLKIASRNIDRNDITIKASIQFKKDLQASISLVNEEFGCQFTKEKDFVNGKIKDYYKFLYDHINLPDQLNKLNESKKSIGSYKICNDKFHTKYFQPRVFASEYHSWYFSDTPIAILCINSEKFAFLSDNIKQKIFQLIKLEIDLIYASCLTLVLCYNGLSCTDSLLYKIIEDKQFSELHINIFDRNYLEQFLFVMNNCYSNIINFFKGYFYLYSNFLEEQSSGWNEMKMFRQIPSIKIISFSLDPKEALIERLFVPTKPFKYCKTGFEAQYLRVVLCFVPILNETQIEYNKRSITTCVSDLCIGFINPSNFLFSPDDSVDILFNDDDYHNVPCKVYFEDIHLIRPDLFVKDTLSLTPMDENKHEAINTVKEKVNKKLTENDKLQKSYISIKHTFKNGFKVIRRVAYAYTYLMRQKNKDFTIRNTQIYAVLEACDIFFGDKKKVTGNKTNGAVYQIKTGEGKSCIVSLISAVLAIKEKNVHLVSSNIVLSKRDYYESYEFFKLLDLKSAVLLHKNELPFKFKAKEEETNDNNDTNGNKEEEIQKAENNAGEELKKKYYSENSYYSEEQFENPSRMNFSVCGVDHFNNKTSKANIAFSTFVNFECFYLHLMENCPGKISGFFENCGLLIDEVDSILIDEIANGTIISREMKTDAKKVLSFVYEQASQNKPVENTLELLNKKGICKYKMNKSDIQQMYDEIKLVNSEEFTNGKKYIIETFCVKNQDRIMNMLKKTVNNVVGIKGTIGDKLQGKLQNVRQKSIDVYKDVIKKAKRKIRSKQSSYEERYKDDEEEEDENDDDDEDIDEDEEDEDEPELDTSKMKYFYRIVPFDYDHKGMVERNKEFSGFIPQFISIKESKNHPDLLFREISVNYLYVSHPIFAKLYEKICGFTGTVGKKSDKTILFDQYNLATKKVPRHKPNLRVDLPRTVCADIIERNNKIVDEITAFHKKGNPVLVIFQDFNEVYKVVDLINLKHSTRLDINVFNGQNESIKPDKIAGRKGAISLGTNICGRGTNIECSSSYPLHVIVAYYTTNVHVMEQAFGRTARNGQMGTCHCICLESDFNKQFDLDPTNVNEVINEVDLISQKQKEFIADYTKSHPWIFNIKPQKVSLRSSKYSEGLNELKKSGINVNRIVAYRYKYPIVLTYDSFLWIQAQKILSLFNCPNSKYTWEIFKRYVRELLLQSWTLMINKFEQDNLEIEKSNDKKYLDSFEQRLNKEIKKLNESIQLFLSIGQSEMIPTFIHISNLVLEKYEMQIKNSFKANKFYKFIGNPNNKICLQIGFRPYAILSKSGVRITNDNLSEANYIMDPELSYEKKMPNRTICLLSITERIDYLFNLLIQKVNEFIGSRFFIKFFLRRTLVGCEIGIYLDFLLVNQELSDDPFILVDKNPILLATIYVWSFLPILAGILIILIIYLIGVGKDISKMSATGPADLMNKLLKKAMKELKAKFKEQLKEMILSLIPNAEEILYAPIIKFLTKIFMKQTKKIRQKEDKNNEEQNGHISTAEIMENIWRLFDRGGDTYDNYADEATSKLGDKINISFKNEILENLISGPSLIKVGVLLVLVLASFLRNFTLHRSAIKNSENDSQEYETAFNSKKQPNECNDECQKKFDDIEKKRVKEVIDTQSNKDGNEYEIVLPNDFLKDSGVFELLNLLELESISKLQLQISDFKKLSRDDSDYYIEIKSNRICSKITSEITKQFNDCISLFSSISHPVISPFIGFVLNANKSLLLFDAQFNEHTVLYKMETSFTGSYYVISKILNDENRLIFAYGIACALEFLQSKNAYCPNICPNHILMSQNIYPFIAYTGVSKNVSQYEMYPDFLAPELKNENADCDIYKSSLYSFGVLIFTISSTDIKLNDLLDQKKSKKYKNSFDECLFGLVSRCLDTDPDKRPSYTVICNIFETEFTKQNANPFQPSIMKQKPQKFIEYINQLKPFRSLPK